MIDGGGSDLCDDGGGLCHDDGNDVGGRPGPDSDSDEELLHERMARWRRSLKQIFTGMKSRSRSVVRHDLEQLSHVSEGEDEEDGSWRCCTVISYDVAVPDWLLYRDILRRCCTILAAVP